MVCMYYYSYYVLNHIRMFLIDYIPSDVRMENSTKKKKKSGAF